ncbi:hypothetical protein [Desulfovibrio piger]|uniref:hypothetical protein n=1 Tax=Desulfovibrio piger TaxID=901 RepID=UPI0026EA9FDB|nr:hypothetical protein [Desulfovibrio piger]
MLVEVRVKMEGDFLNTLEKIKEGLARAFPLFKGLSREDLAVHHAGLHVSSKGQRSAWLRYRVMPDGDAVDAARAPQRILWVK